MTRLTFFITSLALSILCFLSCSTGNKTHQASSVAPEEALGFHLGAQAYTFRKFTFAETLDKLDSCGLKYVEAFSWQEIGNGISGAMSYTMDAATRSQVKALLQKKGIRMMGYYSVVKEKGEAAWRQVFEFCKDMGVQTITGEPGKEDLDAISALCDEYQINAAIHNHPPPSPYWHPDTVLASIRGRSNRLGACADIGHWIRSGLDPVAGLRKLEGRIKYLHFKDLNERNNKNAHDVIWGRGVCNIPDVISELKRQRFKGMISIEYESNWDNNVPDVKASVAYFRKQLQ